MKIDNLDEILQNFRFKKIAVVGDLMLDEYIVGDVERISPEAPVPVVNVRSEFSVMGGAANVINNLKELGAKVYCLGVIGDDEYGKKIRTELKQKDINLDGLLIDTERPTTTKKRVIAHNQQLLRLDWEKKISISSSLEEKIIKKFCNVIQEVDAVIFSDYDKGVLTQKVAERLIKICNDNSKIVIVDPKPMNAKNYTGATSMTPNLKEAMKFGGVSEINSEKEFIKLGEKIVKDLKLSNLVITRSEQGMSIFENGQIFNIPTVAREVYDVTGAGDTVISVFTLCKLAGTSFVDAARIANISAGIVVSKVGTSVVSVDDIRVYYNSIKEQL